ncbi:MAG TPA: rRNA maturation RNase YbeY [Bacteroidota bacterium]
MVQVINHHPRLRFSCSETQRAVRSVLRRESKHLSSVSVVFVGSRFIRRINRDFLGHDDITDVISFPLKDGLGVDAELYINLERARSQAREYNVKFKDEVLRLVIHGTLHVLGYDDTTKKAKQRMRRREDFYLTRLTKG